MLLKSLGVAMVLLPFLGLFLMMAQTDGTRYAVKSVLLAFGIVGWIVLGTWFVVR